MMVARISSTRISAVVIAVAIMSLPYVAIADVPPSLADQFCGDRPIINMTEMGVTSFFSNQYFDPIPTEGVCIFGTEMADTIIGTVNDDVIFGFGGADLIRGKAGRDIIYAGEGNDFVRGGPGKDKIIGGGGSDFIIGGRNRDVLSGNWGDDMLYGKKGKDVILGGLGEDSLMGGYHGDVIYGGSNDKTIAKCIKDTIHASGDSTYRLCDHAVN